MVWVHQHCEIKLQDKTLKQPHPEFQAENLKIILSHKRSSRASLIHDRKSIQESRQELERYLRSAGSTAEATLGVLEDPALMALYCREIKEMVESLVKLVDSCLIKPCVNANIEQRKLQKIAMAGK